MKELLKSNIIFARLVRTLRQLKYRRMARTESQPFNGDKILTRSVDFLISECDIKSFIETGTYFGYTCRYIASQYPHLPVSTVENNPDFFDASQKILCQYSNIKPILGDSAQTISRLVQGGMEELPLFFLDAHWHDYLPLPAEINSIGHHLNDAVMIIHDFQVPGKDYGFDVCIGQSIGMEMLVANIDKGKKYQVYLPNYTYEQVVSTPPKPNQQLRGYAIIFQEATKAAEHFAFSEHVQWYVRGDF